MKEDQSILPLCSFAKENLNESPDYTHFLLTSFDKLNNLVTEFHNSVNITSHLSQLKEDLGSKFSVE